MNHSVHLRILHITSDLGACNLNLFLGIAHACEEPIKDIFQALLDLVKVVPGTDLFLAHPSATVFPIDATRVSARRDAFLTNFLSAGQVPMVGRISLRARPHSLHP